MFFYALTPDVFNNGLNIYLNKTTSNPEGVAEPIHLYEALQTAVDDFGIQIKTYVRVSRVGETHLLSSHRAREEQCERSMTA